MKQLCSCWLACMSTIQAAQCNTYVHACVCSMVYLLTTRSILYVQPWSHECLAHMKCLLSLLHSSVYTCVDGNLLGLVNSRQWLDQDHCSQATATRGYLLSLLTFTPLALLSSADSTIYVTFFELHIKQETAHTHTCIHVHTCTHTLIRTPSHAYVHTQTCTHTRKAEYMTKFEAHKAQRPLVIINNAYLYIQAYPSPLNQTHVDSSSSHNPHCSGFCLGWSLERHNQTTLTLREGL